jgi:cell wall-associated NlpC family hydrolase
MRIFQSCCMILLLLAASPAAAQLLFNDDTGIQQSTNVVDTQRTDNLQDILLNALSLKGVRYQYGGTSPDSGFDCSGFVRYVFREAANISLPHNARAISQLGDIISRQQLQPGDLVFYNTMKSAFSHVGIYLGNNRFIHAPSSGGGIRIVDMDEAYWAKRFDGARRILQ